MLKVHDKMGLKFYAYTHVAKQIAFQLRHRGVDIVRCEEVGLATVDDETHLIYAAENERIMITFDKGFRDRAFEWLAAGKSHAGVLLCKDHLQGPKGIGRIVQECLLYHELVLAKAADVSEFKNVVLDVE